MTFLHFLIQNLLKKNIPRKRYEINCNCRYHLFSSLNANKEFFEPLQKGSIINLGPQGALILTPKVISDSYRTILVQNHYRIYLEFKMPFTMEMQKWIGEIRWVNSVKDIQKPYSKLGVSFLEVEENSKSNILNNLFQN